PFSRDIVFRTPVRVMGSELVTAKSRSRLSVCRPSGGGAESRTEWQSSDGQRPVVVLGRKESGLCRAYAPRPPLRWPLGRRALDRMDRQKVCSAPSYLQAALALACQSVLDETA